MLEDLKQAIKAVNENNPVEAERCLMFHLESERIRLAEKSLNPFEKDFEEHERNVLLTMLIYKVLARQRGILCSECGVPLTPSTSFEYNGLLYCPEHLPKYDKFQQW